MLLINNFSFQKLAGILIIISGLLSSFMIYEDSGLEIRHLVNKIRDDLGINNECLGVDRDLEYEAGPPNIFTGVTKGKNVDDMLLEYHCNKYKKIGYLDFFSFNLLVTLFWILVVFTPFLLGGIYLMKLGNKEEKTKLNTIASIILIISTFILAWFSFAYLFISLFNIPLFNDEQRGLLISILVKPIEVFISFFYYVAHIAFVGLLLILAFFGFVLIPIDRIRKYGLNNKESLKSVLFFLLWVFISVITYLWLNQNNLI